MPWTPLADGQHIDTPGGPLQVVHTPGHSPDHVVLWHQPSATVFTGDLLVLGGTVVIPASHGGSLGAYLGSLARVAGLEPKRALPAHGPAIDDPLALIDHYIAHRRLRETQILEALSAGDSDHHGHRRAHLPRARSGAAAAGARERAGAPAEARGRRRACGARATPGAVDDHRGGQWYSGRDWRLAPDTEPMDKIVDYINVNRDRYVEQLKEYLAIPSISALPAHTADVRRCAEWTAAELSRIGLQNARLMETPGHPVVYAEWLGAPGAPTILFYGHYDVQPVDPLELWTSPPFEATVRDGELYARGAVDDKGQVFMHMKAIEAHLSQQGRLPVNIKVLLEGEEEVGSANLDDFIKANKAMLGADVVVISDSPMFDRGIPSICYGLRGLAYFQIDVRGSKSDLHSGSFGGAVVNPAMALAQVLAQMKDKGGRIKIPGFYEDVVAAA